MYDTDRRINKEDMEPGELQNLEREYTLSQINWKRSLTEIEMKRQKAAQKERDRLHIDVIEKIANPTMGIEVTHFKLFGSLRKTNTTVHNTIPTSGTVAAERNYIEFEKLRKKKPHAVCYNNFYGCIQSEADKPRTPRSLAASSGGLQESQHSKPLSLRSQSENGSLTPQSMTSSPAPPKYR